MIIFQTERPSPGYLTKFNHAHLNINSFTPHSTNDSTIHTFVKAMI